jgi:hypothetical protein
MRTPQLLALVLLGSALGGCASVAPRPVDAPSSSEDSAVFAAVVRVILDSAHAPVFVDPQPIAHVDSERFELPVREAVAQRVIAARRRTLKQLGLAEAKLTVPTDCRGVLAPPDPNGDAHKSGCPKEPRLIAAVSIPRLVSQTQVGGLGDYRAVREAEMFLGPAGLNIKAFEYLLARKGAAWSLVKREKTMIME